jgi:hypothetical protein
MNGERVNVTSPTYIVTAAIMEPMPLAVTAAVTEGVDIANLI